MRSKRLTVLLDSTKVHHACFDCCLHRNGSHGCRSSERRAFRWYPSGQSSIRLPWQSLTCLGRSMAWSSLLSSSCKSLSVGRSIMFSLFCIRSLRENATFDLGRTASTSYWGSCCLSVDYGKSRLGLMRPKRDLSQRQFG